jgi:hypothetical protein
MGSKKPDPRCSFCRKLSKDCGPLVQGPGEIYICKSCVDYCQERFQGNAQEVLAAQAQWLQCLGSTVSMESLLYP